jgi:hypothetical protein
VRREVQTEEEAGVAQRGSRDDRLAGDVDAGKSDGRQDPDDDEERELPIPQTQRTNLR